MGHVVAFALFAFVTAFMVWACPSKAYADDGLPIIFSNGGTATVFEDGHIEGRCYVGDSEDWDDDNRPTMFYDIQFPDGSRLDGYCASMVDKIGDYDDWRYHVAPGPDWYGFRAVPNGDGTYKVTVNGQTATNAAWWVPRPIVTPYQDIYVYNWHPVISGSIKVVKVRTGGNDDTFSFRLVVRNGDSVFREETFTLKGGQSAQFDGIPGGFTYELTETGGNEHYETEWSGRTGTVASGSTVMATCTNVGHGYLQVQKMLNI